MALFNRAIVTTEEGTTWSTPINGTEETIKKYFMNKYFNVGVFPEEKMEKVVNVNIEFNVQYN